MKTLIDEIVLLESLVAWQAGELSEGQVCASHRLDPLAVRETTQNAITVAQERWKEWRADNPPKVG